jgi:hypothetical protein
MSAREMTWSRLGTIVGVSIVLTFFRCQYCEVKVYALLFAIDIGV